jgi:hypothetical protein
MNPTRSFDNVISPAALRSTTILSPALLPFQQQKRLGELAVRSTGKMCALAKSRGLYVSKKRANRLLKDCKKSHILIEGQSAVLQARRKAQTLHIEVVQKSELRPT